MEISFELKYHQAVVKEDIPRLSSAARARIKSAIETKLATRPEIFSLPLRRSLKGHRKLRVGDHRIIFRVEGHTVFILAILHRSIVYRRATRRI